MMCGRLLKPEQLLGAYGAFDKEPRKQLLPPMLHPLQQPAHPLPPLHRQLFVRYELHVINTNTALRPAMY